VLRYEKRTKQYGAKIVAGGKITVQEETIDDAAIAAKQLRSIPGINPKRVFVLGHSLGGLVAPRIAKADPELAGLVIMAGSTRPLEDVVLEQTRYILSLDKSVPESQVSSKLAEMETQVGRIKKLTDAEAGDTNSVLGAPPVYCRCIGWTCAATIPWRQPRPSSSRCSSSKVDGITK
jgi:pimeloyl-ACP methyl ester carboxylesterase